MLGEMHLVFPIVSSWNLLKTLLKINFLPEVTKTCLFRYPNIVNPDKDLQKFYLNYITLFAKLQEFNCLKYLYSARIFVFI